MAGKRRSVACENRPKSGSGVGTKKNKTSTIPVPVQDSSDRKKQTSILSFWGKRKLVGTKNNNDTTESTSACQQLIGKISGKDVLVAQPFTKSDPETDTTLSDTEKSKCSDSDSDVYPAGRNEQIRDEQTNGGHRGVVSPNELAAKDSMNAPTLGMGPSRTVTPCKSTCTKNGNTVVCRDDDSDSREQINTILSDNNSNNNSNSSGNSDAGDGDDKGLRAEDSPPPVANRRDADLPDSSAPHALSEYEKLRLRNIERNNARLAALGLLTNAAFSEGGGATSRRRPPRKKKEPTVRKPARHQPLRRSSRNRSATATATTATTATTEARSSPETTGDPVLDSAIAPGVGTRGVEEEERYTVSPLLQYEMNRRGRDDRSDGESGSDSTAIESIETIDNDSIVTSAAASSSNSCLTVTGPRFLPPKGLSAIYSLDFWTNTASSGNVSTTDNKDRRRSNWLVGAGKAGMIALWDTNKRTAAKHKTNTADDDDDNDDDDETFVNPLLSWKAHGGRWIADAKFLPGPRAGTEQSSSSSPPSSFPGAPSRLVTAGNDGTVCLWDLSKVSASTGAPRLLRRTGKEFHCSGIFCMDVVRSGSDATICTGSKDKSIVVSSLESISSNNGATHATWRSRFHRAKVGAVKLQSPTSALLASASDDGIVALHDVRTKGTESSSPVAKLEDAHDRPHSVLWDPRNESILVTAGLDPIVKVWDRRNLSAPVASLEGHVPASAGRIRKIHRPAFFDPYSKSTTNATSTVPSHACPFLLTGGQGSSFISMYQMNYQKKEASSLFSRGKLPLDCGGSGAIAVNGKQVAVTVDQGEIIILEPPSEQRT